MVRKKEAEMKELKLSHEVEVGAFEVKKKGFLSLTR
jgi:hypothetical protein